MIYLHKNLLNLERFTINVYGSGGTGSHLIDKLGAIAFAFEETTGKQILLTAYDFDEVSERNVGRSDFSVGDIFREKVGISISKVNLKYGLNWRAKTSVSDVPMSSNFHFICTDNAESRKGYIDRFYASNGQFSNEESAYYLFDIGNDVNFGQIVLLDNEGKLADIDRNGISSDTLETPMCAEGMLDKQSLFINQFMALLTAQMFWRLITDYYLDHSQIWANLELMRIVTTLQKKE